MQVGDYNLTKVIGKGTFGEVYKATKIGQDDFFAIKRISKEILSKDLLKRCFNNEVHILKQLDHPNIIKLHDIKGTLSYYYLVFDYCNGGELIQCLKQYRLIHGNNGGFPEKIVQYLMKQILSPVQYLHNKKIIHRDLKLENLLLHFPSDADKDNLNLLSAKIKLIDFGFSRFLEDDRLAQSLLGTGPYMDPSILQKYMEKHDNNQPFGYDMKADIWSLGAICYELLMGVQPFHANNLDKLLDKVQKGIYNIPNGIKISRESISFINAMLQYDPKNRLDINELCKHDFLHKDVNEFHYLDLNKIGIEQIEMNTKKNNSIWCCYMDNNNNLDKISPDMINNKVNNFLNEKNKDVTQLEGLNKKDYFEEKNKKNNNIDNNDGINALNDIQSNNDQSGLIRKDSGLVGKDVIELPGVDVEKIFDEMNEGSYSVRPMFVPMIPSIDDRYNELGY